MAKEEVLGFDMDEELGYSAKKPIPFKMAGKVWHVKPLLAPAVLKNRTDEQTAWEWTVEFISRCLVKEERQKFFDMLEDIDAEIDHDYIYQLSTKLIEKVSGVAERPTESPDSSGNGAGRTSTGSKANSLAAVKPGKS